jgi:tetratricopeptide (TPR) repeat protein
MRINDCAATLFLCAATQQVKRDICMEKMWYYAPTPDDKRGPLDASMLRSLIDAGIITRDTDVRTEDMPAWIKASDAAPFAARFTASSTAPPSHPGANALPPEASRRKRFEPDPAAAGSGKRGKRNNIPVILVLGLVSIGLVLVWNLLYNNESDQHRRRRQALTLLDYGMANIVCWYDHQTGTLFYDNNQRALAYFQQAAKVCDTRFFTQIALGTEMMVPASEASSVSHRKIDNDAAANIFQNLAAEYPDYPRIHILAGNALLNQENMDAAKRECRAALAIDPYDAVIQAASGLVFMMSADPADLDFADASFARCAEIWPENLLATFYRGEIYERRGNFDAAIQAYQYIIAHNPRIPEWSFALKRAQAAKTKSEGEKQATAEVGAYFDNEMIRMQNTSKALNAVGARYGQDTMMRLMRERNLPESANAVANAELEMKQKIALEEKKNAEVAADLARKKQSLNQLKADRDIVSQQRVRINRSLQDAYASAQDLRRRMRDAPATELQPLDRQHDDAAARINELKDEIAEIERKQRDLNHSIRQLEAELGQ